MKSRNMRTIWILVVFLNFSRGFEFEYSGKPLPLLMNHNENKTIDDAVEMTRNTIKIRVRRQETNTPPVFVEENVSSENTINKQTGEDVVFKCESKGKPTPNITWYKNNESPVKRSPLSVTYDKWRLLVRDLAGGDTGRYECRVCNPLGCIQRQFELFVQGQNQEIFKPVIRDGYPGNKTVETGQSIELVCPLNTTTEHTTEWMMEKYVIFNDKLIIKDIKEKDEGWYTCYTSNSLGKDMATGYLTVKKVSKVTNWLIPSMASVVTLITVIALMVFVKLKRDKQQVLKTTEKMMSEQWTKIVSIERAMSNGYCDSIIRIPVVKIEKQKLSDVNDYNYSKLAPEYVLPKDASWEISKQDLQLEKVIGEGEFGKVVKAECLKLPNSSKSETVAVKMLKDGHSDADMISFVSEMEIMKMVGKHENIINLLGCCTRDGVPYIVVEYAENGCLRDFLRKHKPGQKNSATELKQWELVKFALQVAKGMEYLVKRGCVHRDLAARNVLVSGQRVLKVADFGLARDVRDSDYYRKHSPGKLPLRWMAPESLCDNYYNNKSDVWSFGILTWEIMTLGNTPYQQVPAHYLYHYLRLGRRVEKPQNCSQETYDLIKHCCTFNPDGRPTFKELTEKLQAHLKTSD